MSGLDEFTKAAARYADAATAATRLSGRVAVGLLLATAVYALAAIWQATHAPVVVVPAPQVNVQAPAVTVNPTLSAPSMPPQPTGRTRP